MIRIILLLVISTACLAIPAPYYPQPDPYATPPPWRGPIHIPQLRPDGVPREPPEVEAVRQQHLSKVNEAYATAAPKVGLSQTGWGQNQQTNWAVPQNQYNPTHTRWNGPIPEFGPNGIVLETRENQIIRQQHMEAYNQALARTAANAHYHG